MIAAAARRRKGRTPADSARSFIVTISILCSLALLSYLAQTPHLRRSKVVTPLLVKRDDIPWGDDDICRHVHRYQPQDQCAFVKANCPDEEAGLFSYLSFYYCDLPHVKPIAFILIACWSAFLFTTIGVAASDFFCVNLSTISNYLGMSESMAGVTFLAFGNGSPDVFSTFAAVKSHSGSLAVGELIGAAGFITAVVAGSMAVIRPFHVYKKSFVRDVSFFIVAVAFTMYFLANGELTVWECAIMVAFYIFYVIFVLVWHWYLSRRRKRKERLAATRAHYLDAAGLEGEVEEQYRDLDDGETGRSAGSRPVSSHDFEDLEGANGDEADDEETRDKLMSELTSNMRVRRTTNHDRKSPFTPIRPSLVGALEFQSVLASLKKSRNRLANSLTLTTNTRRYSTASVPEGSQGPYEASVREHEFEHEHDHSNNGNRGRAVSVNDAAGSRLLQQRQNLPPPTFDLVSGSPLNEDLAVHYGTFTLSPAVQTPFQPSPVVSVTSPDEDYFTAVPKPRTNTADLLAPPPTTESSYGRSKTRAQDLSHSDHRTHKPDRPHIIIPQSPRGSPGLSPIHPALLSGLSSASGSRSPTLLLPELCSPGSIFDNAGPEKELTWWPYKVLPSPSVIARTIFPTIYGWNKKSIWGKVLGVLAAPSFLLLAITLPVVETSNESDKKNEASFDSAQSGGDHHSKSVSSHPHISKPPVPVVPQILSTSESLETEPLQSGPEHLSAPVVDSHEWNRWLVLLQCVTAPWFGVLVFWANNGMEARALVLPTLYSLVASLVLVAIVLLTTNVSRPPRWHFLLCFVGFGVAVTWISSIANEIVGIMKTIGIIFNMSDAILGLTVFACGNSIGDLVADVTIARLGFSVMALSACLGGPMLNILLGVGLSGLYMTITGAEKRAHKHPERGGLKFKPYHVDVSITLLISAGALMLTLVGMLVAVRFNNWQMNKRIGYGLISFWVVTTVINVAVEVSGLGDDWNSAFL